MGKLVFREANFPAFPFLFLEKKEKKDVPTCPEMLKNFFFSLSLAKMDAW